MKKNTIILLTIVVLLIIGGLAYYYSGNNGSEGNTNTQPNENQIVPAQVQNNPDGSKAYTIEMTSSGFAPNNLEINKGDSIEINPNSNISSLDGVLLLPKDIRKVQKNDKD